MSNNTKRTRGDHYKPGEIKKEIVFYVLNHPDGIDEPTLREHFKNEFNINEAKNIKNHLKDLQKNKCIKKIEKCGLANTWIIGNDVLLLKNIIDLYPDTLLKLQAQHPVLLTVYDKHADYLDEQLHIDHGFPININKKIYLGKKEAIKQNFLYRMMCSPKFFKLFLIHDSQEIDDLFYQIYSQFETNSISDKLPEFALNYGFDNIRLSQDQLLNTGFKACVVADSLDGFHSENAVELIHLLNARYTDYVKGMLKIPGMDGFIYSD